jgi:hypothetical protein
MTSMSVRILSIPSAKESRLGRSTMLRLGETGSLTPTVQVA